MAYGVAPLDLVAHQPALAGLWRENFEETEILEYIHERFDWLYRACPPAFAKTWIGLQSEGAVVGCGSAFRADRYLRGRQIAAAVTVVFAVDRRHQLAGAALSIQRRIAQDSFADGCDVLVGRPNVRARPIAARIGWRSLGRFTKWVKVFADGRVPATPVDLSAYRIELLDEADARFDALWTQGCGEYAEIICERGSAYLNRRFAGFQELPYRLLALVDRTSDALVGYVIFCPWFEGTLVADLFCVAPAAPVIEAVLSALEAHVRTAGSEWVAIAHLGAPWLAARFAAQGYDAEHEDCDEVMICVNPALDQDAKARLLDPSAWSLFDGDTHIFV